MLRVFGSILSDAAAVDRVALAKENRHHAGEFVVGGAFLLQGGGEHQGVLFTAEAFGNFTDIGITGHFVVFDAAATGNEANVANGGVAFFVHKGRDFRDETAHAFAGRIGKSVAMGAENIFQAGDLAFSNGEVAAQSVLQVGTASGLDHSRQSGLDLDFCCVQVSEFLHVEVVQSV